MEKKEIIRLIYLYLFSTIGLLLIIIGSVKILDIGLRTFVFQGADIYYFPSLPFYPEGEKWSQEEWKKQVEEQQKAEEMNRRAQKQREISTSLSMIFVGLPLFLYHWKLVQKNK